MWKTKLFPKKLYTSEMEKEGVEVEKTITVMESLTTKEVKVSKEEEATAGTETNFKVIQDVAEVEAAEEKRMITTIANIEPTMSLLK